MKEKICIRIGAAGGLLAAALGGWDLGLQVLLGFMAADLGTGLLTAGVFHNSPHTKDGRLDSRCCFQGICRKAEMLVFVGAANAADLLLDSHFLRILCQRSPLTYGKRRTHGHSPAGSVEKCCQSAKPQGTAGQPVGTGVIAMQIQNAYLTHNRPKTRRSRTTAIAVHWVANPNSTAMANRNYFNKTRRADSRNYIIELQGEILSCTNHEEPSWCTNEANSYTVSVECCHPDWTGCFTGKTYTSLVELTARLCQKYHLDPQNGGVIRHYDVTRKICPKWFVPASRGGSDTNDERHWKQFLHDVAQQMQRGSTAISTPAAEPDSYRVRVTVDALRIRKGAGTSYAITGCIRDKGVYTIIKTCGNWGKLKSGAGWICLGYCRKL